MYNVVENMASGSSAAMAVGLMIYLLLASHVDACYLRNCPIGGKRELRLLSRNADNNGGDDALVHWFDRLDFQPHAVSLTSSFFFLNL